MKKFLAILSALMLMILALVPMTASAASSTMYIDSNNGLTVRIHKTSSDGNVICNLGVGFPVSETGAYNNGYSQISFKMNGRRYTGWIMDQFLSGRDTSTARQRFTTVKNSFTVTVRPGSGRYVNLRASGTKSSTSLRHMYAGEKLTVLRYSHAWYEVEDQNGNIGYVAKAYVRKV